MKTLLLALIAGWIAVAVGRIVTGRLRCLNVDRLEQNVYSGVIGTGIIAYGTLLLGLIGLLKLGVMIGFWVVLAALSARQSLQMGAELSAGARAVASNLKFPALEDKVRLICIAVVCVVGASAVVLCFRPPGGHEWDALAYHLADPKMFLQAHRIWSLPTEHHSNFPFTIEMLFVNALLFDGASLAALMHLFTAVLTVGLFVAFCRRRLNSTVGWLAAALFATTPVVVWEASSAYIDVGYALFVLAGSLAAVSATLDDESKASQWAVLAGIEMGLALGSKYLALAPFVLVGGMMLTRRCKPRTVAIYAVVALVVGSPWYLKNIILVHNPVYPFYYRLFSGSRYWSADRAAAYQSEQDSFGFPHKLSQPSEAVRNLVQSPWSQLVSAERYANNGDFTFSVMVGGAYAALCFALPFLRRRPGAMIDLFWLGAIQLVVWFFNAQIGRYMVSMVPLFAIPAAYAAWSLAFDSAGPASYRMLARIASLGAIGGQAALMIWGLFALPTSARAAAERGIIPTSESLPETIAYLAEPGGSDRELRRTLAVYPTEVWINEHSVPGDGVVLYDETRGFYLDRPVIWGNGEHSSYIPYQNMHNGTDLTAWMRAHGVRFALVNVAVSPRAMTDKEFTGPVAGNETGLLDRWYASNDQPAGSWRAILADALRSGQWTAQFAANGVIVIRIGPDSAGLSTGSEGGA